METVTTEWKGSLLDEGDEPKLRSSCSDRQRVRDRGQVFSHDVPAAYMGLLGRVPMRWRNVGAPGLTKQRRPPSWAGAYARGRRNVNVAPSPSRLSTARLPPASVTRCRANERPSPEAPSRVVKYGSKMRSS